MKLDVAKNASRNVFFGIAYKIVVTFGPFAMRTVLLYVMGAEYLGLNGLFASVLGFLSLTELGLGNAMVYAMYKPIAEDDDNLMCALLKLYRKLYYVIGSIILGVGLAILPFMQYLVKGSCPPDVNLYFLYLIYLGDTVISYFFFGYKQSVLVAYQREDIRSKRSMIVQLGLYIVQAFLIITFKNYYLYSLALPVATIITNIANAIIVKKLYPQYTCKGEVPSEITDHIKKSVKALVGNRISMTVQHSSDTIIISAFLGLSMVAIYENYYLVLSAIIGFTDICYWSFTAGLGNSVVTESVEKNKSDFDLLTFVNIWLISWCSICYLCLVQPFMQIWVGNQYMMSTGMVILFVFYFYLYQLNRVVLIYEDATGLWWEDRFRPYIITFVNLGLNIAMVNVWGTYGVIISTIVAMCISLPIATRKLFLHYFKNGMGQYVRLLIIATLELTMIALLTYGICSFLPLHNNWTNLICRGIICVILPNAIYYALNYNDVKMQRTQDIIRGVLKR